MPASEIGRELLRLGPDTTGLADELGTILTDTTDRLALVTMRRALADTSVFIGLQAARFDAERFAGFGWGVSVVSLGELRLGVPQARTRRPPRGGYRLTSSPSDSGRSRG